MKHHIISPKQDQGNALILSLKLNRSKSYSSQPCLTPSDLSGHVYLLLEVTIIFSFNRLAVWSKMSAKWREMSISVSKKSPVRRPQMSCLDNNPKILSLQSWRTKETRKYSHLRSWNQIICTFFPLERLLKMIDQLPKQLPVNLIVDLIILIIKIKIRIDATCITAIFHYYSEHDYILHIPLVSQESQDRDMLGELSLDERWKLGLTFFRSVQLWINRNINFHQPWEILTFSKEGGEKNNILCM